MSFSTVPYRTNGSRIDVSWWNSLKDAGILNDTAIAALIASSGALSVQGTEGAPISVSASAGIVLPSSFQRLMILIHSGAAGTNAITATPQIPAGTKVGQEIVLVYVGTNGLQFNNGNGIDSNGPFNMTDGCGATYIWRGSAWWEASRREN